MQLPQRHVLYVHRYGQPVFAHTLAERAEVCLSGIHPDTVLASPHTAGVSHEARHRIAADAARRILDVLDGQPPANALNPEIWPRFEERRAALFDARTP